MNIQWTKFEQKSIVTFISEELPSTLIKFSHFFFSGRRGGLMVSPMSQSTEVATRLWTVTMQFYIDLFKVLVVFGFLFVFKTTMQLSV